MATPQQQALTLIQTYYSTFNSGDRGAFLALLAEDVVHEINQGGAESGRVAFAAFLERMDRCYREQAYDIKAFASADGTQGAAEFFIEGIYLVSDTGLPPATGQPYRLRVGAFFDLQDGKVQRVTNYYNLEEWLRQIGASNHEN